MSTSVQTQGTGGILTKGTCIAVATSSTGTYIELPNLLETPAVGGTAERVDVTTLADSTYRYIAGIRTLDEMDFQFIYDGDKYDSSITPSATVPYSSAWAQLKTLQDAQDADATVTNYWKLMFPDGTSASFSGRVSLQLQGATVNEAAKFTANIACDSKITFA